INQLGVDNSFATDHPRDEMRFGKGGVDDAEDAEVILHELGHQIHFSQSATFFASNEAGSISEGFGDYWAANGVEIALAQAGLPASPDPACVADWDSVSYTAGPIHCLRRLDTNLMYADRDGRVHRDGQIWSHALWNLRTAIGPTHANTSILWAQFGWTGTTMTELAQRIVDQGEDRYGAAEACVASCTAGSQSVGRTRAGRGWLSKSNDASRSPSSGASSRTSGRGSGRPSVAGSRRAPPRNRSSISLVYASKLRTWWSIQPDRAHGLMTRPGTRSP